MDRTKKHLRTLLPALLALLLLSGCAAARDAAREETLARIREAPGALFASLAAGDIQTAQGCYAAPLPDFPALPEDAGAPERLAALVRSSWRFEPGDGRRRARSMAPVTS